MNADELKALQESIDQDDAEPEEPTAKGKKGKKTGKKVDGLDGWWAEWGKLVSDANKTLVARQIVRTGIPQVDLAFEIGGVPMGAIMTLFGPEGSAKSTLAQVIVGQAQKQYPEKIIVWVDAEASWNGKIAQRNGVTISKELFDAGKIIFLTPSLETGLSYEKIITMLEQLMAVAPDGVICVVDSLDAMSTSSEIAKSAEEGGASFGGMAKANSITLKRIVGQIRDTDSCLILIQQLRDKVDSMGYGEKTDTSGGHAPKHYSAVRLELKPAFRIKHGEDEIIGHSIKAMLRKNRYGQSWVQFGFDIYYDHDENLNLGGIDRVGGLIDVGAQLDLVKVSGASHIFNTLLDDKGEPIKRSGRQKVRQWLLSNKALADKLADDIMKAVGIDT